jgi:hypothetical protein
MRQLAMIAAVAAAAAISSSALAQNSVKDLAPLRAEAPHTTGQASKAPIGHRQPRVKDVPADLEENLQPSLEDRKLDERLNICRGC